MEWFKKLKIANRFYLFIGSCTLIIFLIFALYLNNNISNTVSDNYLEAIDENILNIETMLELEIVSQREKTFIAGNLAKNYFENMGTLRTHNDLVGVGNIQLNRWTWNNRQIHNNIELVDAISNLGAETVTVFQKFDQGYIRISTNVRTAEGERAIGTHIGWDSPVVQAIEKGERFQGRAWVVDRWYVTDYQPIIINGEVQGILYVGSTEVNYGTLSAYFKSKDYFGSGFPFIVNSDGVLTAHPAKQGQNVSTFIWFNEILGQAEGILRHTEDGNEKTKVFKYIEDIDSYIVVEWYSSDFDAVSNAIARIFAVASVIAIVVLLLIVYFLIKSLNKNLEKVTKKMQAAVNTILDGDLKSRADLGDIHFEFAPIITGLNKVLDTIVKPLNLAAAYIDRISKGDMPEPVTDEYKGELNHIKENLNLLIHSTNDIIDKAKKIAEGDLTVSIEKRSEEDELMAALSEMVQNLKDIVENILEGASNIAAASGQMSSASQQMSSGTSEQAASAEEVSTSIEQMAANISQNSDNAQQTEKIAVQSSKAVSEANEAVGTTVKAMQEIAEKIGLINAIAEKTDILAINAAIEAARAGEHGKGFAVVAAEVRKLAENSQVAAKEIGEVSRKSLDISHNSGTLLSKVVPDIQRTTHLVQEIAAASAEQSSGINQINSAIGQFNSVVQQNAASSEELSSNSEELSAQADTLKELVEFFRINQKKLLTSKDSMYIPKPKNEVNERKDKVATKHKGIKINLDNKDTDYDTF